MAFSLTAENPNGDRLTLTGHKSAYVVTYTGLGPVGANVITSGLGMVDGEKFNSAHVGKRNVVLTVNIRGNVESNRLRLYDFFTPKQAVKLYYQNGARDVYTEGIVESCEPDQFSQVQSVVISIICPQPYLIGAKEIVKDISDVTSLFYFPFAIEEEGIPFSSLHSTDYAVLHNTGNVTTGFIITVYARNDVTAPVIYNAITNEAFRVNGVLEGGHTLTIDTRVGHKRLTITAPSGIVANALYRKQRDSIWLQLAPGENYFSYSADNGADYMLVTLRHNNLFVGV